MKKKYRVERGIKIDRAQLSNNDYNPNKTTERQQQAIAESLDNYGQLTSVLVRPDPEREGNYIIIDGEHRSQVLTEEVYVDVVYGLKDTDAKKLTVIMNETRGSADKIELAQLLNSLNDEIGDLQELSLGLPYEEIELQELIDLADVDWDNFEVAGGEEEENNNDEEMSDDWTTLVAKMSQDALDVFNQATDLIKMEKDLHEDKAHRKADLCEIALGQVLECLAAEYIASNYENIAKIQSQNNHSS